ncbi:hypothetical protein AM493_05105 [Flavobacterium akiainvivens]|uniref:Uncharacterized protein n=1 Tax=Flavobacterium akiainvivens TaxID=1202724 RepID=A0A0M9VHF0_9FLAO|nr:hypothetical protein [Flavobacterium akiainvivens]KOS05476.1 hypothetical protein AM493_05105 [Flavobacterium akiainvivens]SFQ32739.1 hypothetical protein SAMN05444144_10356 [Flavobacterium akiainvivens]
MELNNILKTYLYSIITIEFKDRESSISGFLLDYSEEWILLQYNPQDYIIDGYILIRNSNIDDIFREEPEDFTEKVIRLKGFIPGKLEKLPLTDTVSLIEALNNRFGIFSLYKKSETSTYPGRLLSIDQETLTLEWLDTKARWTEERVFKLKKIRVIEFNTDYLISLKIASENLYN